MKFKRLKVITIAGTRPEFIKLSETIKLIDRVYEQILVNTNQNFEYELNKIFFKDLNIRKPDYSFNKKAKTAIEKIADNLIETEAVIKKERPDVMLVLGDTNSGLSVYVAKRHKIPIFHIEAGNRCFDQNVPEEINRKIIDNISDINLVYSNHAKEHLIRENFHPASIIKVGSPMMEIFKKSKYKIKQSNILKKLKLKKKSFFLISYHREENLNTNIKLKKFINIIKFLNDEFNYKIIISTHYKLKDKLRNLNFTLNSKKIEFLKPFGYFDYCKLLLNAKLVLSDSGSLNEEASIMGFQAVNLRESHERHEADDEAITQLISLDEKMLYSIIKNLNTYKKPKLVQDYNVENFSEKIVKLIGSYTSKVNRDIWKVN